MPGACCKKVARASYLLKPKKNTSSHSFTLKNGSRELSLEDKNQLSCHNDCMKIKNSTSIELNSRFSSGIKAKLKNKILSKKFTSRKIEDIMNKLKADAHKSKLKAPSDSKGQLYYSAIQTACNEVVKICPIVKPLLDFLRLEIIRSSGGEGKEPDKAPVEFRKSKSQANIARLIKDEKEKMVKEIHQRLEENLDLDAYNITSDDFRSATPQMKSRYNLPKLDFKKIFEWREKANVIKNNDVANCDIDDEKGLQKGSEIFFCSGDTLNFTSSREKELHEKKQNVLKLMNKNLFDIRRKELSNSVKKTVIDKDLIDSLE
ncbi:unnamed protein product [Moneuplotes crassus]|uniref:Uncharacterized protein n=1 Tax=Euplotes crassus TaxID=5936 RepID=A0AAD1U7D1_EUPCR|nr:unnamed protein product [Moneuplotes crassus]